MKSPFHVALASTLVAIVFSSGCEQPAAPYPFPADAIAFEPPAIYAEWWQLVESCTGRTGSLSAISWYHAATPGNLTYRGEPYGGLYFADGHRILLSRQLMLSGETVRHEMIHALAAPDGHPREVFGEQCAHLQQCTNCGFRESQRGVASTAPQFTASILEVSALAEPSSTSVALRDGWFRFVVSARNPRAEAVWISLPSDLSFSWLEVDKSGSGRRTEETRLAFRPGETRSYVFDLRESAGSYRYYGNFGGNRSDTISVTVAP